MKSNLVRYYPPAGSSCSVRDPDLWPSFWTTVATVPDLIPQLRTDVLIPPEFGMYFLVRDDGATAASDRTPARWAPLLNGDDLPPGPIVHVRVVEAPSRHPSGRDQPSHINGPWGPVW